MKFFTFFIFIQLVFANTIFSQKRVFKDTLYGTGEEIVVTANRSERKLSNVAVPTQLLSRKSIQQTGSLKLQDILQEQTGLILVNSALGTSLNGYPNPFGQGIQMLGLDPAYTAILIDGEPLIGRNAGILKLGRLATGNIRQVEIVKGPSSSLYGSEAMAGVINILTNTPQSSSLDLQLHQATNNTWGGTIAYSNRFGKTAMQIFANRYVSAGYDLDPAVYGKTVDPFSDWNGQLKIVHDFSRKVQLQVSLRNYDAKQNNDYQIFWQGQPAIAKGFTTEKDRTAFVQFRWLMKDGQKIYLRNFYDRYTNNSFVNLEKSDTRFDETAFDQTLIKPELQYEKNRLGKSQYVAAMGALIETMNASRYAGMQKLSTLYAYSQKEWYLMRQRFTIIAGVRGDKRTDFAMHISPRLAFAFQPSPQWKFTASLGSGFKAPDFRHMYLDFYNAQIGYSLLGSSTLGNQLQKMQQLGQLQSGADINPYLNGSALKPETSYGFHAGAKYTNGKLSAGLSFFRNDIDNLIDVYALPFTRSNGLPVYSYRNVVSVFTEGMEADISYRFNEQWSLATGYQFLIAKDKQVLENIDQSKIYQRDPVSFQTSLVSRKDYEGLPNRSKHAANVKLLYQQPKIGFDAYIRAIYRGSYGFMDNNGNAIIDNPTEMTAGFTLLNVAASQTIAKNFRVQVGVENLFNYTNPIQLPNIAGRLYFININLTIQQHKQSIKTN